MDIRVAREQHEESFLQWVSTAEQPYITKCNGTYKNLGCKVPPGALELCRCDGDTSANQMNGSGLGHCQENSAGLPAGLVVGGLCGGSFSGWA